MERVKKMKDSRKANFDKRNKNPALWPPAGQPKKGAAGANGQNQNKAGVTNNSIRVKVAATAVNVDTKITLVNGSALGTTICPSEIVNVVSPEGVWTEVVALYDNHSMITFVDPSLEHFCSETWDLDQALVIKTFSGEEESADNKVGELTIPVAGAKPIIIQGILKGKKRKASHGMPLLPPKMHRMRATGVLAREPKAGVEYPIILFGADLMTKVFPQTVWDGQEMYSEEGFTLMRSKITGKYIPAGGFKQGDQLKKTQVKLMETHVSRMDGREEGEVSSDDETDPRKAPAARNQGGSEESESSSDDDTMPGLECFECGNNETSLTRKWNEDCVHVGPREKAPAATKKENVGLDAALDKWVKDGKTKEETTIAKRSKVDAEITTDGEIQVTSVECPKPRQATFCSECVGTGCQAMCNTCLDANELCTNHLCLFPKLHFARKEM
jgi:hypothetical protein